MSADARVPLYTTEILSLAVELSRYPLQPDFALIGEARSRSCGSTIRFGCTLDAAQAVDAFGLQVSACAIGQAAAAIFARAARGRSLTELEQALQSIGNWLEDDGDTPAWPGIELLETARAHRGRHEAILLPWKAACRALSNHAAPR